MLTGKQKRFLRAMGTELEPIVHVGKGGITDNLIAQIDEVLEARELIKVKVLPNCEIPAKEVAAETANSVNAEIVQVIGKNYLLYKESTKKQIIQLP